jgi:hypothetical protein
MRATEGPSQPAAFAIGLDDLGQDTATAGPTPEPSLPWKVIASGGSTGRPKLIAAEQAGVVDAITPLAALLNIPSHTTMVVPGPLSHNAPFVALSIGLLLGNQRMAGAPGHRRPCDARRHGDSRSRRQASAYRRRRAGRSAFRALEGSRSHQQDAWPTGQRVRVSEAAARLKFVQRAPWRGTANACFHACSWATSRTSLRGRRGRGCR